MKTLPKIPKVSFEETLGKHVLPSLCIGCGSCVVVCPFNCLKYVSGKPVLVEECKSCGICPRICPKYDLSMPALERLVFGRERKKGEDFGVHRRIVIAQTTDENIKKTCQDGGIATALLVHALEDGVIDGTVLSGASEKEPLKAVPKLAVTKKEILECAGTRYTYSPNMLALKEGILQKKKSLAFVGTPCQIHAIRKIQAFPLKRHSGALAFTIGILCSECFTYDGLVKKLMQRTLGIDPRHVKKVNIKGKMIITTKTGEVNTVPLKEAKKYVNNCVSTCSDFAAELADISVGGLGLDDWTFTILRTERGEDLFQKAESKGLIRTKPVEEEQRALNLLVRLSRKKRENVAK
ncbi:MAG: Coenzyme F420 hydrogenase/dehydrogenase, beta subunit C-terminal domain [Candidatus Bathyarchaeota archaeon]|nr:Coenzyme F420 hydrogenase/dehydrogenase, beta subunit C-terminal domain [Candidatus Bathyarchaeota archaeon]